MLVRTGKGQAEVDSGQVPAGLPVYADLAAFVRQLLDHGRRV